MKREKQGEKKDSNKKKEKEEKEEKECKDEDERWMTMKGESCVEENSNRESGERDTA